MGDCGCSEIKEAVRLQRLARQKWHTDTLALLSEAVPVVDRANRDLAMRLMTLIGELNALGVNDEEIGRVTVDNGESRAITNTDARSV